jgi:hypothetical protein
MVDSSQRVAGSLQASRYSQVYSSKSATSPLRRDVRARVAAPAAFLDEALGLGGDLVGIDLVAQQQQDIGPLARRLRSQALDQCQERVHLAPAVVAVLAQRVRRLVRQGDPARPEHQAHRLAGRARAYDARGEGTVRQRPAALAVEVHLIGNARPRFQTAHADKAVVMARHAKRRRRAAEHLYRARAVGFHPEGRLFVTDVPQEWPQHQAREGRRHRGYRPALGRRTIVLAAETANDQAAL